MTKISQQNADNLEIIFLIWVQQLHLRLANMKSLMTHDAACDGV